MFAYRFEDGRGGDRVERHLDGFTGIVQVDGYGAYNRLARKDRAAGPVTLAACWSHVRRYFFELHAAGTSRIATCTIEIMAHLWATEKEVRGQNAEIRAAIRQEKSAPIVAALFNLWAAELPRLPGKSKLAEAIRYAVNRREILERFLHDGRIELDNNTVERAIRPQTITERTACSSAATAAERHGPQSPRCWPPPASTMSIRTHGLPRPSSDRSRLAKQQDRRTHAMGLPSLTASPTRLLMMRRITTSTSTADRARIIVPYESPTFAASSSA